MFKKSVYGPLKPTARACVTIKGMCSHGLNYDTKGYKRKKYVTVTFFLLFA